MTSAKTVSFMPPSVSGTVGNAPRGSASTDAERAFWELVCKSVIAIARSLRRWKLGA